MKCTPWGHWNRWLIWNPHGEGWVVVPPAGSFWGVRTSHPTFAEARLDFIRQTAHVRRRP